MKLPTHSFICTFTFYNHQLHSYNRNNRAAFYLFIDFPLIHYKKLKCKHQHNKRGYTISFVFTVLVHQYCSLLCDVHDAIKKVHNCCPMSNKLIYSQTKVRLCHLSFPSALNISLETNLFQNLGLFKRDFLINAYLNSALFGIY